MIYQMHDLHGRHICYNGVDAENNRKYGWRDVTEEEFFREAHEKAKKANGAAHAKPVNVSETSEEMEEGDNQEREVLCDEFEARFGKRPHGRMTTDNIRKALSDNRE